MIKRLVILFALVATLALPGGLMAAPIPLTLVGPIQGNTVGPQSASDPCIIAGTSCSQPATMGFNNFTASGSISSYNMYSTSVLGGNNGTNVPDGVKGAPYTVANLLADVGSSFNVAIDVNTADHGETLQLFEVLLCTDTTCGTTSQLYLFTGPALIGNIANNGNGFADFTLNTVSLASLPTTDLILFHAVWNNASDGAESFFLVPTSAVPEPLSLVLLGFGLTLVPAGRALARRRRSSR